MIVRSANAKRYVAERRLDGLNIEQADLRVLAVDMAVPVDDIAVLLRCHPEVLLRKAKRWGLPVSYAAKPAPRKPPSLANSERDISRGCRPRYGAKLDLATDFFQSRGLDKRDPSPEELEYLYVALGLSKRILDNLLRGRAGFLLERAGLEKRSATEQRLRSYDASFFGEWTPASAWVIGLIYTDGNLSGGKVTLSSVDEDSINKAQALAAPALTVQRCRQSYDKSKFIWKLTLSHPRVVDALVQIGLTPRKSSAMIFPSIPASCVRHFVRGCWDGDGGFTSAGGRLAAHYTCGSLAFIERLVAELFQVGITKRIIARADPREREALRTKYGDGPYPLSIYKRSSANAYDLRFGSYDNLSAFYRYLYEEVDMSMCLERKRVMLEQYVGQHAERRNSL